MELLDRVLARVDSTRDRQVEALQGGHTVEAQLQGEDVPEIAPKELALK
ncbi:hypothetical protein [Mitsuaria sp. 7]|nr:hypothetical protein [Mitsuaria sp. 7]